MNDKPILMIPIETKVREFEAKLLLALFAAEKGFAVILGEQRAMQEHAMVFGRGVYLDKSFAATKAAWFEEAKRMGNVLTAWDEEGLVYFDREAYIYGRMDPSVMPHLAMAFAWGQDQMDVICSADPSLNDVVRMTGNPRFDLLRPELRPFLKNRADALRRQYGRIILFNSSFPFANHFNGLEAMLPQLKKYPIWTKKPEFFPEWIEVQKKEFAAFCNALPQLSRAFPDHTIIVRPHPSEKHETWNDIARDLKNVVVRADGSADNWILASEVMVHSDCTTGIEAFLLDVPGISFSAAGTSKYRQPLPTALSLEVTSVDGLLSLIADIIDHPERHPPLRNEKGRIDVARHHICGLEGQFASERVVKALAELDSPQVKACLGERFMSMSKLIWRKWLKTWRQRGSRRSSSYVNHKFPGLEPEEVRNSIRELSETLGRFVGARARMIAPTCFEITDSGAFPEAG